MRKIPPRIIPRHPIADSRKDHVAKGVWLSKRDLGMVEFLKFRLRTKSTSEVVRRAIYALFIKETHSQDALDGG